MNEAEVIQMLLQHAESFFPKVCPNCQRRYTSIREYLLATERIGPILSYDAEVGNWNPTQPLGSMALVNCACGSTLAITADGMPLPTLTGFLNWVRIETQQRGVSQKELLGGLRDAIEQAILDGTGEGGTQR